MPRSTSPMPDQESSQNRRAQRARSYDSLGSPANPRAARSSRPRWSSTRYSITWSARPRTDCGIVSPMALAVLRLITSSNFVGCLLDWQVGGLGALENLVYVNSGAPE